MRESSSTQPQSVRFYPRFCGALVVTRRDVEVRAGCAGVPGFMRSLIVASVQWMMEVWWLKGEVLLAVIMASVQLMMEVWWHNGEVLLAVTMSSGQLMMEVSGQQTTC